MENNELLKSISDMMDTKLKPIKEDIQSLKQGQEDIKKHITNNNIAIGDIITKTLEKTYEKVNAIEGVTKDNLYDITLLKNAK